MQEARVCYALPSTACEEQLRNSGRVRRLIEAGGKVFAPRPEVGMRSLHRRVCGQRRRRYSQAAACSAKQ